MPANRDAIWWQGVDISSIQPKNGEAIPSGLRRAPQWGCVTQFFLSESERAGIEQKSVRRQTDRARRHSTAPASGGAAGTSPTKRAQHRVSPSPFAAKAAVMDGRKQRPSSAPTLLRNDAPGLHVRKVHENPSIQRLENFAVKKEIQTMKREGMFLKDSVADVDVLADSSLFDLKVLHNGAQRARSSSASSASRRKLQVEDPVDSKKVVQPKRAADYVRDLCGTLKSDTREHCSRMHIPMRVVEDAQLGQLVSQLHQVQNAAVKNDLRSKMTSPSAIRSSQGSPSNTSDAKAKALRGKRSTQAVAALEQELALHVEDHESMHFDSTFMDRMKGLFNAVTHNANRGPLVKLAYFLNGGAVGARLRMSLEAFDSAFTGSLTAEDFSKGLQWMDYTHHDGRDLFHMLDTEGVGNLDIDFVEDRLMQLIRAEESQT